MDMKLPPCITLSPLKNLLELPPEYIESLQSLRRSGKKIGITCGAFDLLHAGHMIMMCEAKGSACDFLFVGLQTDPTKDRPEKNMPVESVFERRMRLETNKYVDGYALYEREAELEKFLSLYACDSGSGQGFIDVRILDIGYERKPYTGRGLIKPYYNTRDNEFSSTALRERVVREEREQIAA